MVRAARQSEQNTHRSSSLKVAVHGLLIKGPIGHTFAAFLQQLSKGSTGTRAKALRFFTSLFVVCDAAFVEDYSHDSFSKIAPLQNAIFLASAAVFHGARTLDQIRTVVRASLPLILKVTWVSSTQPRGASQRSDMEALNRMAQDPESSGDGVPSILIPCRVSREHGLL